MNRSDLIRSINASNLPGAVKPLAILALGQLSDDASERLADYLNRILVALKNDDRAALHTIAVELADILLNEYQTRVK